MIVTPSTHAILRFRERANRSESYDKIAAELSRVCGDARAGTREIQYCGVVLVVVRNTVVTVLKPDMQVRRYQRKYWSNRNGRPKYRGGM